LYGKTAAAAEATLFGKVMEKFNSMSGCDRQQAKNNAQEEKAYGRYIHIGRVRVTCLHKYKRRKGKTGTKNTGKGVLLFKSIYFPIANELFNHPSVKMIFIDGEIFPSSQVTYGTQAFQAIQLFRPDWKGSYIKQRSPQ